MVKHVLVGGRVQAEYVRWSAKCIGDVPQLRYEVAEHVPSQLRSYPIGELCVGKRGDRLGVRWRWGVVAAFRPVARLVFVGVVVIRVYGG